MHPTPLISETYSLSIFLPLAQRYQLASSRPHIHQYQSAYEKRSSVLPANPPSIHWFDKEIAKEGTLNLLIAKHPSLLPLWPPGSGTEGFSTPLIPRCLYQRPLYDQD